jgi:alkylhydroperoxidase family enzyme
MARIAPLEPPYADEVQNLFDWVMPEGMDPIVFFRTLATCERVFKRFMRGGVLDRGPVDIRDRELVIHRTTARCKAEYEWGVHVTAFARPLELSEEWIAATVLAEDWRDPVWTPRQAVLVRLCDELHETQTVGAELWDALGEHFDRDQIVELIYIAGFYHLVSFLVNSFGLEGEPNGETFPTSDRS